MSKSDYSPDKSPVDSAQNSKRVVLLVDDSEGFRKQLKWLVITIGYTVAEAGNGEEAIKAARHQGFNLIIMNMSMPVVDGFAASRKIREMESYRQAPILALSAYDSSVAKEAALQAGCNYYFNKLTDIDLLVKLLQRFNE